MENRKHNKMHTKWIILMVCIILVILGFSLFLAPDKIALRSDSKGVEYVMEGETITRVYIRGQYPYNSIIPTAGNRVTDAAGNITEIYTIEAEFLFHRRNGINLHIETSDEGVYTYILKFADKDVKIVNGKVVD